MSLYLRKCGMLLRTYEARLANICIWIDMTYWRPVFSQWAVGFIHLLPSSVHTIFRNQIIHKYSDRDIDKNPNRHRTTKLDIWDACERQPPEHSMSGPKWRLSVMLTWCLTRMYSCMKSTKHNTNNKKLNDLNLCL